MIAKRLMIGCGIVALVAAYASRDQSKAKPIPLASSISQSDREQGAKAHPELLAEFGGAYSGPQSSYVTSIGRKIAVQSSLSKSQNDFTITLLNSPVNNAFAIPGGYVYITRQLMALCNDEAEMAGVLGHEIGHVAAMHSQRRQKAATRNAIGGALLQILTGAVLGNSGLGSILQKGIGQGTQLLTLKFSRSQEYEADDLGISYLARGGYDATALSSMLASLAAQSSLDARVEGRSNSVPEWASTHPDPASRVSRALSNAKATRSNSRLRNRDPFLNALDGVVYGDDPKQGVVDGSRFIHPDLKISFTAPSGYAMVNGTQAVSITGSGGQAQFSGAQYNGNLDDYVASVFQNLSKGNAVSGTRTVRTTINGIPAAYATTQANSSSGAVDVTVVAYEMGGNSAYHFIFLTPSGQGFGPFKALANSFQKITPQEAAGVKARRIDVVTVRNGDTIASLSSRMAYSSYQQDRFLTLNGLSATSRLTPGQRVKIIAY